MRFPVALLVLGIFVAGTIAAQARESDSTCAATFTALSQSARANNIPAREFDRMAATAVRHGGSAKNAAGARDLSLTDLSARVVNCHAQYDARPERLALN